MTNKTRLAGIVGGCAAVLLVFPAGQAGGAHESVHATGCSVPLAVRVCQLPPPGAPLA